MPYGHLPARLRRPRLHRRLAAAGGPHHQVMHLGRQLETWRVFCELTGIELETA